MKICSFKYRGAFALAAKIAGLLPYGAFALRGFCPTTLNRTNVLVDIRKIYFTLFYIGQREF